MPSLVGSEMCIRDSLPTYLKRINKVRTKKHTFPSLIIYPCVIPATLQTRDLDKTNARRQTHCPDPRIIFPPSPETEHSNPWNTSESEHVKPDDIGRQASILQTPDFNHNPVPHTIPSTHTVLENQQHWDTDFDLTAPQLPIATRSRTRRGLKNTHVQLRSPNIRQV